MVCVCNATSPEPLLNDDRSAAALLVALMLLVGPVAVLDDGSRLTTLAETLLGIVRPKLTLDEDCCLGHLLVVHILANTHNTNTDGNILLEGTT